MARIVAFDGLRFPVALDGLRFRKRFPRSCLRVISSSMRCEILVTLVDAEISSASKISGSSSMIAWNCSTGSFINSEKAAVMTDTFRTGLA